MTTHRESISANASRSNLVANARAAVAAVFFGASVVAVRIAVRDVTPLTLAFLRFAVGAVVLLAGLALVRRDLLRMARRDLPYLALIGAIFYAAFPITFNAGLRYIPASRAAIILATMPLWSVVLARSLARERLARRQLAGVLISIAGVAVVMMNRGAGGGSSRGDLLLVATAILGAIYNVLAKRAVVRHGGVTVTFYAMMFGSLVLAPALATQPPLDFGRLGTETILLVLFLAIPGGALAFSLWTSALRRLSPTEVAVYINLNPLAATAIAATVLHERLSVAFVAGFVAVAAGLMIVNWTPRESPRLAATEPGH
jgi:drug/metabolite transporter (DMT)-like permease